MADLTSTAPWVYNGFFDLLVSAAGAMPSRPQVVPFMLEEYEPADYIMLSGIENHRWDWETIGSFSQTEHYSITGVVTVYVGDSPDQYNIQVASDVMDRTYYIFNTVVMTTFISNRLAPVLNNAYVNPGAVFLAVPGATSYTGAPGSLNDEPAGWAGTIDFRFDFGAYITPA